MLRTRYALRRERAISQLGEAISKRSYIEFAEGEYIELREAEYIDRNGDGMENRNQLREDCIELAILVSDLCDDMKGCQHYVNQVVRSSSSIGANVHEARYAQSRADFISKLEIALKESSETEYWLEMLFRKGRIEEQMFNKLRNTCGTIRRRLIASVTTAKRNMTR